MFTSLANFLGIYFFKLKKGKNGKTKGKLFHSSNIHFFREKKIVQKEGEGNYFWKKTIVNFLFMSS